MRPIRRFDVLIAACIFLLNAALTYPLFLPGDTPYRDSIEGGYAGMARFIDAHPSPWGWNPLQYCGLPTQFLYVPALHYAVAVLPGDPVYTYKLLTATLACLGPATLYLCLLFFTGSRLWATATAIGYTFYSPAYGLIPQADKDRGLTYLPWRLHVYAKYGEGPHNAGLTLMPVAWMMAWVAATGRRFWQLLVLAVLMAAITLTNWIAGLALAISLVLMMVAAFGVPEFRRARLFVAGAIAYGMACFWLTPTFIYTIAFNWPADAFNYQLQAAQYRMMFLYVAGLAGLWVLLEWLKWPFWEKYVTLAAAAFGYPVMMHYSFGRDMIPESRRYALEFELFLMAAIGAFLQFTTLQFTTRGGNRVRHACALIAIAAFVLGGARQVRTYLTQPRSAFAPIPVETTPEYRAGKWLADRKPQGRVLASGGLRFRLNSWFDVQQVGGAFESGLRNRTPVHFSYHVRTASGVLDSVRVLKSLGVEYVAVHGPKSAEHYRDYTNPTKFEGALEKVYGDEDDVIYRVPFRGLAHAIRPEEEPPSASPESLDSYVRAIEDDSRPQLTATWLSKSRLRVDGTLPEGMLMSVQVTHDPGWTATHNGRRVNVERDTLGFIKVRSPGPVDLEYAGTPEQKVFGSVSALTWIGALTLLWKNRA